MKNFAGIYLFGFCLLCTLPAPAQSKFEGKAIYEIVSLAPGLPEGEAEVQKAMFFFKGNQVRFETDDHSTCIIYDYEQGDQLLLMNVPGLELKQAILSNISRAQQVKIEKVKEFKTIMGTKCQKVNIYTKINNQETKAVAFVDFSHKVITGLDLTGNAIFNPMYYEFETTLGDGSTIRQTLVGIQKDSFNDKLFKLNYPNNFAFSDERTDKLNELPDTYEPDDKDVFMKLATAELDQMVKTALETEDFETASMLKEIIGKREREKVYNTKSLEELQGMISAALDKEDYKTAEEIQETITNRLK